MGYVFYHCTRSKTNQRASVTTMIDKHELKAIKTDLKKAREHMESIDFPSDTYLSQVNWEHLNKAWELVDDIIEHVLER